MIKVSFHKINTKKSRIWSFLTPGLAECTRGLAESGLLAESTLGLAEPVTQNPKNRMLQVRKVDMLDGVTVVRYKKVKDELILD
uniref:Uncharacterized protein n=1 Tax=Lactuca sativa TaxID=4236 RepID=A0A9R1UKT7_LACSA|nr:hypothetical protein LSAT_V11C800454060 [Lactuca sativa]